MRYSTIRALLYLAALAKCGTAAPLHTSEAGYTSHLAARGYEDDAVPRGWWKVVLITLAFLLAIGLLVFAAGPCCIECCGINPPVARFEKLSGAPETEQQTLDSASESQSSPTPQGPVDARSEASTDMTEVQPRVTPYRPGQAAGTAAEDVGSLKAPPPSYSSVKGVSGSRMAR